MSGDPRRYAFPPLERRGVMLGLPTGSLVALAIGCCVAIGIVRRSSSVGGFGLAFVVVATAAAGACWPIAGQTPVAWLPVTAGWVIRRGRGPRLSAEPTAGRSTRCPEPVAGHASRRRRPAGVAPGIELMAAPERPGAEPLGVVRDRVSGTWGAVVRVEGRSFALLDGADKERRLATWGSLLAGVARPGSPAYRLQWVEQVRAGCSDDLVAYLDEAGVAPSDGPSHAARDSYAGLVAGAGPASRCHGTLLALTVHPRRAAGALRSFGRGDAAMFELLRREVRLLVGQIRSADLGGAHPLDLGDLTGALATGETTVGGPARRTPGRAAWPGAWPLATDEAWSVLRADGGWHATYWIAEWPRLEVGPDFLTPLLATPGPRRVSLVMAPVDPQRAAREAGSAAAADLADEELRRRAGFIASVRRQREAAGVLHRRSELADGHAEYRFSGYVTVSAGDRSELQQRCAEIEQAAQQSHLELRRLYGRQAEAYTWTLPLGRGLA